MWFDPRKLLNSADSANATSAISATSLPSHNSKSIEVAKIAKVASIQKQYITNTTSNNCEISLISNELYELGRQKAILLMQKYPETIRGIYVDAEINPNNVVIFFANKLLNQTCEIFIPKDSYDAFELLCLIEQLDKTESIFQNTSYVNPINGLEKP